MIGSSPPWSGQSAFITSQYGELHCQSWLPASHLWVCCGRSPKTRILVGLTTVGVAIFFLLSIALAAVEAAAAPGAQERFFSAVGTLATHASSASWHV